MSGTAQEFLHKPSHLLFPTSQEVSILQIGIMRLSNLVRIAHSISIDFRTYAFIHPLTICQ